MNSKLTLQQLQNLGFTCEEDFLHKLFKAYENAPKFKEKDQKHIEELRTAYKYFGLNIRVNKRDANRILKMQPTNT